MVILKQIFQPKITLNKLHYVYTNTQQYLFEGVISPLIFNKKGEFLIPPFLSYRRASKTESRESERS